MDDRMSKIEERLNLLEKGTAPKKERKPRAPSDYQKFIKEELPKLKKAKGEGYDHRAAFSEVAKMWTEKNKKAT